MSKSNTDNIQDLLALSERLRKFIDELFDEMDENDHGDASQTPSEKRAARAAFLKTLSPIVGEFRHCMKAIADLRKIESGERHRLRMMTVRVMTQLTTPLLHELRQVSAMHSAGRHNEAQRQLQVLIDQRLLELMQEVSTSAVQEVVREQGLQH